MFGMDDANGHVTLLYIPIHINASKFSKQTITLNIF